MNDKNPNFKIVVFYNLDIENIYLQNALYGMEEENVEYELFKTDSENCIFTAFEASNISGLNVGICINAELKTAVLHFSYAPEKKPVIIITPDNFTVSVLREFGHNAARLVKNEILKPL